MSTDRDCRVVVNEVLGDVALLIGSVAAARKLPDELIEALISRLDRVRVRTLRRLSDDHAPNDGQNAVGPPPLHPAVESFLIRNGRVGQGRG